MLQTFRAWAQIVEPLLFLVGGLWALYLYRVTRRGEVRVGIEPATSLVREWQPGRAVLLVRLRIANSSTVLYRHREATATLFDARKATSDGAVLLVPFSQADPIPPVYGDISTDTQAIAAGQTFALTESDEISLEPGEHFDSELAFVLRSDKLGLMAMRVLIRGHQRRWRGWRWRDELYWWGTFFFIDPFSMETERSTA